MKFHDEATQLADAVLTFRRYRLEVLPRDIFGEPAWELLLEVFVADSRGMAVTGRIAAKRSATPEPVMSRWLQHLTAVHLLVGDGTGNLDDELTLSGSGMAALEDILVKAQSLNDAFAAVSGSRQNGTI